MKNNRGEVDLISVFGIIAIFLVVVFFVISIIQESKQSYWINMGTFNIKSVKTTDKNYSGSFFLGSGSFEGRTYFYSYVEIQPGIYQLKRYDSRNVTISERNEKPSVTVSTPRHRQYDEYAAFVVPPGTIIEQFRLE